MVEQKFTERALIFSLVLILFFLLFLMLKNIIIPIILGLLFSYIFGPVYGYMKRYLKNKDLTAIVLIALLVVLIAIPLYFLIPTLARQIFEVYMASQKVDFANIISSLLPGVFTQNMISSLTVHLNNFLSAAFSGLLNSTANWIINFPNLILKFAVFLFTFYFALRDSEKLKEFILKISPLSESTEKIFLKEFKGITNSIIYGQFVIGVIQGLMVGLGLLIIGFPGVLILTFIAILASVIPILGSWLVWLPVSIYLIVSGSTVSGTILLLYGLIIVSTIDNVLRTIMISKSSRLHPALGLIGVIAGLYSFGPLGLILGPLILAYILIIIDFYKEGKLNEMFKK